MRDQRINLTPFLLNILYLQDKTGKIRVGLVSYTSDSPLAVFPVVSFREIFCIPSSRISGDGSSSPKVHWSESEFLMALRRVHCTNEIKLFNDSLYS